MIYVQNQKFIGAVLPGYGTDTIDLSVKIPYAQILKDMKKERKIADSADYSVNVWLQISTSFWKGEIPIHKAAKLRIPHPPEIEVMEVEYKKVHLRHIIAIVKVKVINHNPIALTIKEMKYSMKFSDKGNITGSHKEKVDVKPNGQTFIDLPMEINFKHIGKIIMNVLTDNDDYPYVFKLNATLEATQPMKESFHVDLTKSGKMELKK